MQRENQPIRVELELAHGQSRIEAVVRSREDADRFRGIVVTKAAVRGPMSTLLTYLVDDVLRPRLNGGPIVINTTERLSAWNVGDDIDSWQTGDTVLEYANSCRRAELGTANALVVHIDRGAQVVYTEPLEFSGRRPTCGRDGRRQAGAS